MKLSNNDEASDFLDSIEKYLKNFSFTMDQNEKENLVANHNQILVDYNNNDFENNNLRGSIHLTASQCRVPELINSL